MEASSFCAVGGMIALVLPNTDCFHSCLTHLDQSQTVFTCFFALVLSISS